MFIFCVVSVFMVVIYIFRLNILVSVSISSLLHTRLVSWQCRLLSAAPEGHDGCFFEGSLLSSRRPIRWRLRLATLDCEVGGQHQSLNGPHWLWMFSPFFTVTKATLGGQQILHIRPAHCKSYLLYFHRVLIDPSHSAAMLNQKEKECSICSKSKCACLCVWSYFSRQLVLCGSVALTSAGLGAWFPRGQPTLRCMCTQLSSNTVKVALRWGYWWQWTAAGGNVDEPRGNMTLTFCFYTTLTRFTWLLQQNELFFLLSGKTSAARRTMLPPISSSTYQFFSLWGDWLRSEPLTREHHSSDDTRHLRRKQKQSVALLDIESVHCENECGVRSPGFMYCNGPEGGRSCEVQCVHLLTAQRAEL